MKLLVQKGAEVQAKANGAFFQYNSKQGFYFGECNQIFVFLMLQAANVGYIYLTNDQCWERYFKKVISYSYSLLVPKSN